MNSTKEIYDLTVKMREIMSKVDAHVAVNQMVRVHEVSMNSFVQIVAKVPITPGTKDPYYWQYEQFWVDKVALAVQEKVLGAYLNEWVNNVKVIGIFEQVG